jgi:hypothetical protein
MNITKLNFSDKDFIKLVNSYLKILIWMIDIDWNIDKKEVRLLFSLLTRIDIEDDNSYISKLNYYEKHHSLKNKILTSLDEESDYLRVLDLENIIFYEWEKWLHLILSKLSKKSKLDFEDKMKKLEKYLWNIKEIIESKKDILWENYINLFYFWIYFYSELIAKQDWKFLWKKIVEEEKKYLQKIKEYLDIDLAVKESVIAEIRKPILDI